MGNSTILITGATSGIGYTTAEYLASVGYQLVLTGRNREKLKEIQLNISEACVAAYEIDLTNTETIEGMFDTVKEQGIRLDGLIHCAGVEGSLRPVRSIRIKDLDLLIKLHYEAFVEMGRLFYKKAISNEGSSIIAISSLASLMCQKNTVDYSTSKAAVNAANQARLNLPPEQADYLTLAAIGKLFEAMDKIEDLEAAAAVTTAINALPAKDDVAPTDKTAIEAARQAYDALTDAQKALIDTDTLTKLTDAEAALADIEAPDGSLFPQARDDDHWQQAFGKRDLQGNQGVGTEGYQGRSL